MKIVRLLTDNGGQLTDHFTSKKREPTGLRAFDAGQSRYLHNKLILRDIFLTSMMAQDKNPFIINRLLT